MHIYHAGRQRGKTFHLLQLLRDFPSAVMVVSDEAERRHALKSILAQGAPNIAERVLSAADPNLRMKLRGRNISYLYVDNLERVMTALIGMHVDEATYTGTFESRGG